MLRKEQIFLVSAFSLIGLVCFLKADVGSEFSWMAFQERDLAKAAHFLNTGQLDFLGPEVSLGGNLPGPFLTIIFSITLWIFGSIQGVFYLLQFSILLTLILIFDLLRQRLAFTTALIFAFVFATTSNFYLYSYAAWHAALAPFFATLVIWLGNRASHNHSNFLWLATGFFAGIAIQIHGTTILPPAIGYGIAIIYDRKRFVKPIPLLMLGFILSLSYYIYHDSFSGFSNSISILSSPTSHMYLNIDVFDYLFDRYFYYSALHFLSPDSIFGKHVSDIRLNWLSNYGLSFKLLSYILQTMLVLIGIVEIIKRPNGIPVAVFLVITAFLPILYQRPEARFYMFSALCWPLLFSVGAKWLFFDSKMHFLIRTMSGVAGIVIVGISLATGSNSASQHTIYYKSSSGYLNVTQVLLSGLNISPTDFKKSFYFYRGQTIWPFWADTPLPSKHTYSYMFGRFATDETRDLGNNGLILLRKSDRGQINLDHVEVVQEIEIGGYIALIYSSPYLYRMVSQYSDSETTRQNITDTENETASTISKSTLLSIDTKNSEKLDFNANFKIKQSSDGLVGFAEIASQQLRHSQFAGQSPYFIVNPTMVVQMKGGRRLTFPLMENHLYKNQDVLAYGDVYELFGTVKSSNHLGSFFVEAPYGRPIKISDANLNDISHLELHIEAYGDISTGKIYQLNKTWLLKNADHVMRLN